MKAVLAGVIAMTLTATASTVFAGETPAPAADTTAAAASTPLVLHPAAPPPKPLTLAPANEGMGAGTKILLVLAVGAGVALYLKKKKAEKAGGVAPTKIDILARAGLGVRSQLVVIEVEGTRLLVGMTPSAIQTLAVLDTPEGVGTPAADLESAALGAVRDDDERPRPANLGDRFRSLLGSEEAEMPRISPLRPTPAKKPSAARSGARASTPRAKTSTPRDAREIAGQARGLMLSVDEDK